MDRDAGRNNISSNGNFQQRVMPVPVEVFEYWFCWTIWIWGGVGSITREHPALMVEIGIDGQHPLNNSAECHNDTIICFQINAPDERTIWEYQNSITSNMLKFQFPNPKNTTLSQSFQPLGHQNVYQKSSLMPSKSRFCLWAHVHRGLWIQFWGVPQQFASQVFLILEGEYRRRQRP